jgi:hypothetical protein
MPQSKHVLLGAASGRSTLYALDVLYHSDVFLVLRHRRLCEIEYGQDNNRLQYAPMHFNLNIHGRPSQEDWKSRTDICISGVMLVQYGEAAKKEPFSSSQLAAALLACKCFHSGRFVCRGVMIA